MRVENGIPRPFQPNQQAQELRDLKRKVAELEARRTWVSVERIVEGGTLNKAVSNQITETVQKDLVVSGDNLSEGALDGQRMVGAIIETNGDDNRGVKIDDTGFRAYDADGNRYMKADETGLEMTGSIASHGTTAELTPRPIRAQLGRVSGGGANDVPGLVFQLESETSAAWSPGVYSLNGTTLTMVSSNPSGAYGQINVSAGGVYVEAQRIQIGEFAGGEITVGNTGLYGVASSAKVNLLGDVNVNGSKLGIQHAEFTTSFSLGSSTTVTKVGGTFTRDNTQEKNGDFATPGAGTITLQPGVYAIHYRADCGSPMGDTARLGLWKANLTDEYTAAPVKTGEWDGVLQHPNLYIPTTTTIGFNIRQNSGATRSCNVRVAIEKIK